MRSSWYKLLASRLVTKYWPLVLLAWTLIAFGVRALAPSWDSIAADGDLAFLPDTVPSAVGQRALEDAFPGSQTKSQLVLVFASEGRDLQAGEIAFAMDVTRRLHWLAAHSAWQSLKTEFPQGLLPTDSSLGPPQEQDSIRRTLLIETLRDNVTEIIELETALATFVAQNEDQQLARLPEAYEIRSQLLRFLGEDEQSQIDAQTAELIRQQPLTLSPTVPDWSEHVKDVWSWRSSIVGHKLGSQSSQARMVMLQLATDFTATANIGVVSEIEALIAEVRQEYAADLQPGLRAEISGSAAVGADMLRAAAGGVKMTESVTIVLVLAILIAVYRAPFLVAIPITSIALSLVVATGVIALLARDPANPDSYGIGVFTTTRIFIVVLLFGAGTDFCLFFLARNRELLRTKLVRSRAQMYRLIASGWRSVHDALLASACTTMVGLALMWFSRFEKFQFSGPIIAISLGITLLVCLTFTPALLSMLGRLAFWPLLRNSENTVRTQSPTQDIPASGIWAQVAKHIVAKPGAAMLVTLVVLGIPAIYGLTCLGRVTYDLTEELSESAPSRRGAALIQLHFPARDNSPVSVVLRRKQPFESEDAMRQACSDIAARLYTEGVESVRSLTDPLGDYPPGKRMGLFDQDAWRRRVLQNHRITKQHFVSTVTSLADRVAKFDVVLSDNPFSLQAGQTLDRLRDVLAQETASEQSPWSDASVAFTGTTVGITDLRAITQTDQRRIQILVTIGVWFVLFLLLRKPVLSCYLIFTVLLSYFATLGITYATFAWTYGEGYTGLDWKVPLFLFVILVAVGQDYNVYLVTRIQEERRKRNLREAVRHALQMTGGIITSCGFVMAGTFIAMTSPAAVQWLGGMLPAGWLQVDYPVLRGITELGFALAVGVLLDTLVVRSILVPSFVVLQGRHKAAST